jgi:hypothetical protein
VQPLAQSLGIPFDATFSDQDYGALAKLLLSDRKFGGKSILVCWHHGNFPGLVRGLGATSGSYPNPWDFTVFNLVLAVVTFDATSAHERAAAAKLERLCNFRDPWWDASRVIDRS